MDNGRGKSFHHYWEYADSNNFLNSWLIFNCWIYMMTTDHWVYQEHQFISLSHLTFSSFPWKWNESVFLIKDEGMNDLSMTIFNVHDIILPPYFIWFTIWFDIKNPRLYDDEILLKGMKSNLFTLSLFQPPFWCCSIPCSHFGVKTNPHSHASKVQKTTEMYWWKRK